MTHAHPPFHLPACSVAGSDVGIMTPCASRSGRTTEEAVDAEALLFDSWARGGRLWSQGRAGSHLRYK